MRGIPAESIQHPATQPATHPATHTAAHTAAHTATLCDTLQHTLQHYATHCNTHCNTYYKLCNGRPMQAENGKFFALRSMLHQYLQHTATHRNALQHTATHCNALQHTATHCNKQTVWRATTRLEASSRVRYRGATLRSSVRLMRHVLLCGGALQHTATHCNTLQHNATLRLNVKMMQSL